MREIKNLVDVLCELQEDLNTIDGVRVNINDMFIIYNKNHVIDIRLDDEYVYFGIDQGEIIFSAPRNGIEIEWEIKSEEEGE